MPRWDAAGLNRLAMRALLAGASLFVVTYVVIAIARMAYPFELEWIEGVVLTHVDRLRTGAPLYTAPSMDYVPLLYPPLYYALAALLSSIVGATFLPLRLLSFLASLGLFAVIYHVVYHETRERSAALLGVTLFAATFAIGGGWFDVGRNDSVFLFFSLAGAYTLRRSATVTGAAGAAVLLALGALTKQSALLIAAPLGVYALLVDWKRGLAYIVTLAVLVGGATWALDSGSDGWYRYYTLEMPRHHALLPDRFLGFWTEDLIGRLPIATLVAAGYLAVQSVARRRGSGYLLALASGLVAAAWSSRLHTGGYDNVLIPAYLAVAILAALAFRRATDGQRTRAGGRTAAVSLAAYALAGAQFLMLVYNPATRIPSAADRDAGEALVREIAAMDGDVWITGHGYLARLAGKPPFAHAAMIHDVLRAGESRAKREMTSDLLGALERRRFAALVMDWAFPDSCPPRPPAIDGINWVCPEIHGPYRRTRALLTDPDTFWPVTGSRRRPVILYVARDSATTALTSDSSRTR